MNFVRKAGECIHFALSSQPRINSPMASGHVWLEVDTGRLFLHDGTSWVETTHKSIPIGGIYLSSVEGDPATFLNYGSWEAVETIPPIAGIWHWKRTA